jgi:cell division initiation protein
MLTPLDIESKEFKKKAFGYSVEEVDCFLDEVIEAYEKIYKENIELKDKISMLNEGVQYYKTIESTLQNTLILAEKTAEDTKAAAHHKGEQIKKDAELKADETLQEARKEVFKIHQNLERLKKQYESAKIQMKQILLTQMELLDKADLSFDNPLFEEIDERNLAVEQHIHNTPIGNEDAV